MLGKYTENLVVLDRGLAGYRLIVVEHSVGWEWPEAGLGRE